MRRRRKSLPAIWESDTYLCPAGQFLYPRRYNEHRQATEYQARKGICAACALRRQCTRAKAGRTIMHHRLQELIDIGHQQSRSKQAYEDGQRRKWLMEGSFGQAVRHHFKRARYRRLWRQQIQDYLIGAVQNIKKFINHSDNCKDIANRAVFADLWSLFSFHFARHLHRPRWFRPTNYVAL